MKLIARKDFFNTAILNVKVDEKSAGFKHTNVIHKGSRFAIGTAEFYDQLSAKDQEYAGTLIKHGLACLDNEENVKLGVVKKIDQEVQDDLKLAKAQSEKAGGPGLIEQIVTAVVLAQKSIAAAPAK